MSKADLPPGVYKGRSVTPNQFLKNTYMMITEAGFLDAEHSYDGKADHHVSEIQAGTILGRLPDGLLVPVKRTQIVTAGTGSALPVRESRFFKAGDTVTVGSTTSLTVGSINYDTDTITVSASVTVNVGDRVFADGLLEGAGTHVGYLMEWTRLQDEDGEWRPKSITLLDWGKVDPTKVLGDVTAVREAGAVA